MHEGVVPDHVPAVLEQVRLVDDPKYPAEQVYVYVATPDVQPVDAAAPVYDGSTHREHEGAVPDHAPPVVEHVSVALLPKKPDAQVHVKEAEADQDGVTAPVYDGGAHCVHETLLPLHAPVVVLHVNVVAAELP